MGGRQCQEFLVCNQFVRTNMGGDVGMQTNVQLDEPTPLVHGKTAPANFIGLQPTLSQAHGISATQGVPLSIIAGIVSAS